MATPLTPAQEEEYRRIIDGILEVADLKTVSVKKVRKGLEAALGGRDLSEQKNAIKSLIEERFDAISADATPPGAMPTPPTAPMGTESEPDYHRAEANGHSRGVKEEEEDEQDDDGHADDVANGEISVSLPVKAEAAATKTAAATGKKRKYEDAEDAEDADARLAAELQAQENQMGRGRTTRGARGGGGVAGKAAKKKKAKRARERSDKKVRAHEDSDVLGSDEEGGGSGSQGKRRRGGGGGGFQKLHNLSYPLAALVGEAQLSRPQVVKKLWEHIKGNELQDPKDRRQIRCDDAMQAVFKQAKVDMFQMNKLLGNHLYPIDENE